MISRANLPYDQLARALLKHSFQAFDSVKFRFGAGGCDIYITEAYLPRLAICGSGEQAEGMDECKDKFNPLTGQRLYITGLLRHLGWKELIELMRHHTIKWGNLSDEPQEALKGTCALDKNVGYINHSATAILFQEIANFN
jgi:hypothetical protein